MRTENRNEGERVRVLMNTGSFIVSWYFVLWVGCVMAVAATTYRMKNKCYGLFRQIYGRGAKTIFVPYSWEATRRFLLFWRTCRLCEDLMFKVSISVAGVCLWALVLLNALFLALVLFAVFGAISLNVA